MANIRDYNESDDVEQPDEPDDDAEPEPEPSDETTAEWDRIIDAAEKRGGTKRGEVLKGELS